MLRRTGFKRSDRRPQAVYTGERPDAPRAQPVRVDGPARLTVAVPKDKPIQHAGYMAQVRRLPCIRCGYLFELSQFCHADILGVGGKGRGIKSDCRLGWAGCGPHGGTLGCHWFVGTSGVLPKAERHAFEKAAGDQTRHLILEAGWWPLSLPYWPADEVVEHE